jgi:alpha-L-fucosidase
MRLTIAALLMVARLAAGQTTPAAEMARAEYRPTLESIGRHKVPAWYANAKLGIFVHWGLYSVPAWAPPTGELGKVPFTVWFKKNPYAEWYLNTMKIKDSPTWEHHAATWGAGFKYEDFIPLFQKESRKWKPEEWAALFAETGARYVVLTTKHADGYPLWPSAVKHPHLKVDHLAADRDYVGELTHAVRARGMKMGTYYCGGMDWSFVPEAVETIIQVFTTVPQSPEYVRLADAHWRELITRYQPDVLWNDISYPKGGDFNGIISDYYNRNPEGVINNRFGRGDAYADFTTPEYTNFKTTVAKKWETCRGLGYSFGYNQAEGPEHMLTPAGLVHLLIDIVSKNGNLLLNVGPAADGSISALQLERLRALGQWMKVNGEGIYDTTPWEKPEGRTSTGEQVRFTLKGDVLYAFLLGRPKGESVVIEGLRLPAGCAVGLLGSKKKVAWKQENGGAAVRLPKSIADSHAYVLRISPARGARLETGKL